MLVHEGTNDFNCFFSISPLVYREIFRDDYSLHTTAAPAVRVAYLAALLCLRKRHDNGRMENQEIQNRNRNRTNK